MSADIDMRDHLATALGLTVDEDVFANNVIPPDDFVKARAVFCIASGGPPPEPINGGSTQIRHSTIQLRVRGNKDAVAAGKIFADSVRDAAQFAPIAGFNMIRVQEGEPRNIGQDDQGHPEWSVDVTMTKLG